MSVEEISAERMQSTQPAGPPEPDMDAGEEAVGASDAGKAASEALVAMGRAARCFLIYSADNEAIGHFLGAVRDKFKLFIDSFGEMSLIIRPWEMTCGGEVVYVNRDRERSLSFRLFRDGVRKITMRPEVEWSEISKFLGIISIRFTGVRQQEDDIVTLLWKAGFQNIDIEAVEGFVPEDEETELEAQTYAHSGASNAMSAMFIDAPYAFDVPWPEFPERARVAWAPISNEAKDHLRGEDDNRALPGQCVRLIQEILTVAANPAEPMGLDEALPLIQEIRDFLLSEGLLSSVLAVVHMIDQAHFRKGQEEKKQDLLSAFADARALGKIIHSIPDTVEKAPPDLLEMVALIPGDKLSVLLSILEAERGMAARRILRQLIVEEGPKRFKYLVDRMHAAEAGVATDILQALAEIDIEHTAEVAADLGSHEDVGVQLAALGILERAPYTQQIAIAIAKMLSARAQEVRIRALRIVVEKQERWAFQAIVNRLEQQGRDMESREAIALGEALAKIYPKRAQAQFTEWIKPKGLMRGVLSGPEMLRWAAVAGLVLCPGEEPVDLIKALDKSVGDDLHRHCMQALVRHRRNFGV